jgi:4-hydroxy-3-methylbut-2-enyl diphosphate reductase
MKEAVAGELAAAYDSSVVDQVRASDYQFTAGRLTLYLAREFGFCYGVDRAVDYAYQARRRFPGRNVFLTGEIIHNPHVNQRLRDNGIRFLSDPGEHRETLGADDVVILPAFGVTVEEMARLASQGCTLVDTTCGSVLNVWKNVTRYAQDGFTAIIHGKVKHEETRATASQALSFRADGISSCSTRRKPRWSATTSGMAAIARRSSRGSARPARLASIPTSTSCAWAAPIRQRC